MNVILINRYIDKNDVRIIRFIYIYINLCLKTCCAFRGGLRSIFHLIFWLKNYETFDFSWFQKNILNFFDRQVRLTDSLSWTWQRSGSKISVENLGRKYTYNKKIIWYLIWTYSRIPAGYHDFSPWFFFNRCIFLTALRRIRSIYICMSDDPVHMNIFWRYRMQPEADN